jgi:hypothetical protein
VLDFGIVTLLAGILALAWPGRTVVILAVLSASSWWWPESSGSWPP